MRARAFWPLVRILTSSLWTLPSRAGGVKLIPIHTPKGDFKVFAQVKVGGQVGIVMIQPSPNRKAINTMVRQMLKNGTLKNLEKKYYFASFGGVDPDKLPVWG